MFCLKKYIGESKRPLITRIQEHQQSSRKTAICLHNKECPDFQQELLNRYGHIPNRDITDFLSERFEILHKNLLYDEDRRICEALCIKFYDPELNLQVKHKFVNLV